MKIKNELNILILGLFLIVFAFGILLVPHNHEVGCPFLPGEEVLCPMNLFAHISSWQSYFSVLIPSMLFLIISLGITLILKKIQPPSFIYFTRRVEAQNYTPHFYQELYSRGILNPKAP